MNDILDNSFAKHCHVDVSLELRYTTTWTSNSTRCMRVQSLCMGVYLSVRACVRACGQAGWSVWVGGWAGGRPAGGVAWAYLGGGDGGGRRGLEGGATNK